MRRVCVLLAVLGMGWMGCGDDGGDGIPPGEGAYTAVEGVDWCDMKARCDFIRGGGTIYDWEPLPESTPQENAACGCEYWDQMTTIYEKPSQMPVNCWRGALPDSHPGCSQPGGVWAERP